ncbi:MAG: hypothetical protein IKY84_01020 [Bacteroidaceae bacterium]|nr:hypothetical protein [Bacteroidaceae bacterium]
MKNNSEKQPRRWWLLLPVMAAMLLTTSCREDYYLDEEEPSWLGESIYDFLNEDGKYTYYVRLIEDLDYAEVLAKTGSKTLFVVDDATFDAFFKANDWGVESYEQLSLSHKKLLLNSSMLNNVYFSDMLGLGAGREEGQTLRRVTAVSIYDDVYKMSGSSLPESPYWDKFREKGIVLLKDNTPSPLINFTHDFLVKNNMTNEDYAILTNQDSSYVYNRADVFVNGVRIVEPNLKCKNGVVHRLEKLITPLTNMAEFITNDSTTKRFSQLMNRFAAPYYSRSASLEYQRMYGGSDSVFVKKFMATHGHNTGLSVNYLSVTTDATEIYAPADTLVDSYLKFDPGWNAYALSDIVPMNQDMAVMFVPSDKALEAYWNGGGGEFLKDRFGKWEDVPNYVIDDFVNNHMKSSFKAAVPSKFYQVKNDGQVDMGITMDDVERTIMCSNGVIYVTSRVFPPVSYVAVSAPTLVNENMKIMRWAIEQYGFDAYLLSMDSYYSFILPTDDALKHYVDPLSIAKNDPRLWEFYYDEKSKRVKARQYKYDLDAQKVVGTELSPAPTNAEVDDRLEDLIDNHIIVDSIDMCADGKYYYRTKANGTIKVEVNPNGGLNVFGGYQLENDAAIHVTNDNIKDQTKEGNGKTYIVPSVMQSSIKSVYSAIAERAGTEEDPGPFYEFQKLMIDAGAFYTDADFASFGQTVESFNTYHYTLYIPSNEAVRAALAAGLPTMEQAEEYIKTQEDNYWFDEEDYRDSIRSIIADFVNYHIQDNSVYIGGGNNVGNFETSTLDEITGTFCRLSVAGSNTEISIEDGAGNTLLVDTSDPALYNIMTRDYLFDNKDIQQSKQIETSSFAVIHRIPNVLYHKKNQIEGYIEKVKRIQEHFSSNE